MLVDGEKVGKRYGSSPQVRGTFVDAILNQIGSAGSSPQVRGT